MRPGYASCSLPSRAEWANASFGASSACAQALEQGVYSYKRVQALTEAIFADAINAIEAHTASSPSGHSETRQPRC